MDSIKFIFNTDFFKFEPILISSIFIFIILTTIICFYLAKKEIKKNENK